MLEPLYSHCSHETASVENLQTIYCSVGVFLLLATVQSLESQKTARVESIQTIFCSVGVGFAGNCAIDGLSRNS